MHPTSGGALPKRKLTYPDMYEENRLGGSVVGEYEDCRLLGCDALCFGTRVRTYRENLLAPFSGWKATFLF
jgi:hypothetical protein